MSETKLPEGVTPEMVTKWKEQYSVVKIATLYDADSNEAFGDVIVRNPDAQCYNQFEKNLDRDPLKAKIILVKGTFLTRREEIDIVDKASKKFSAMYDAATQMLQVGKAILKNL